MALVGSTSIEIIEGESFLNESVELDDKHFIHCTFENCIVEYHGGEIVFELSNMRNCRHVFYGRARRTLQYLQGVGLMPHQPLDWGEFPERIQ